MKRFTVIAICAALLAMGAGCNRNNTGISSAPAPTIVSSAPAEAAPQPGAAIDQHEFRQEDEYVEMVVTTGSSKYTRMDFIDINARVTNKSDVPLLYVKGSGSNSVPDALDIRMGDLVGMYKPVVTTSDYQTMLLMPGESIEFKTPFAPYTATGDNLMPIDPNSTLDYFLNAEGYSPATMGRVEGTASFTYSIAPDADEASQPADRPEESHSQASEESGALDFVDYGESNTLTVAFTIELGE